MDWNRDGKMDLISGDADGCLNVFIRRDSGFEAFYKYRLLNGDSLDAGTQSVPTVADWNRDGNRDLIIGIQASRILLYLNQGTDTWPMFQNWSYVAANGFPIIMGRAGPAAVDLDRDGKQDLLTGEGNGFVHFFRNVGSDTNPTLAKAETLRTVSGAFIKPAGVIARDSKIGVGDWNNDGITDILISGDDGLVTLYLGEAQAGVEEISSLGLQTPSLRIEPSPTPGGFAMLRVQGFEGSGDQVAGIRVYDALGGCVLARPLDRLTAGPRPLDLRGLAPGVYLVRLEGAGATASGKLVVR